MTRTRAVLIALAVLALWVVVWRLVAPRLHLLRILGGSVLVFQIDAAKAHDPSLGRDEILRRTESVVRARVASISPLAEVERDQERLKVAIPHSVHKEILARVLARSARLEFKIVDDGSEFMKKLVERPELKGLVEIHPDGWTERGGGAEHRDLFLLAKSIESMRAALDPVAATIPPDHEIALERVEAVVDERDESWRSYYLFKRVEIGNDDIEDAEVEFDVQSGRPEINLHFGKTAAVRFADLTGRSTGRKLAIMLDGRIQSAPVIETRIEGGHARITMGGFGDPQKQMSEARDLVSVLRAGALEAPIVLVDEHRL